MNNYDIISKFYKAFADGDAQAMVECYHEHVVFKDPAFGILTGDRAKAMWLMLLASKSTGLEVSYDNIRVHDDVGHANWVAKYTYGPAKRKVTNRVSAQFKFVDGLIIEHVDAFDLWKWTQQAMGLSGYILGWSGFMKGKIQETTNKKLDAFMGNK